MLAALSTAAEYVAGNLHGTDARFQNVSIDTRSLRDGELFVALEGPNFDGHDYVSAATQAGAAGALVSRQQDIDISQIEVADTREALGKLGAAWRNRHELQVVAITGSNGKTTLKEMVAACLASVAPTLSTAGNYNNDIGMPLMLTRIREEHRYAVLEMGANHAGEIGYLTALASPDVVVITNAGEAHLEGFGSVRGVSRAKGEILSNPKRPHAAILNADDDYFSYWASLVEDVPMHSFGLGEQADVHAVDIRSDASGSHFQVISPAGSATLQLPLVGIHNVRNACAATAVALSLGLDMASIKAALESMAPVRGRLLPLPGLHGCTVFDDSYNANPLSVKAGAEFVAGLPGESWLILGDMFELGDDAEELHREVGASVRASGVDRLLALGELSRLTVAEFGDGAKWFANVEALKAALDDVPANGNVLVKGSRGMRMERIVEYLCDNQAGS